MARYGLRDILDCTFRNFRTDEPFLYMDYATAAENEWTGDQVFARGGRGNPRRISFNDPKDSTLTLSTQIFTMKHLAMLAGRSLEEEGQDIYKREVKEVDDDAGDKKIELSKEPVSDNDVKDDIYVFKYSLGMAHDEVDVTNVDGKDLTLDSDDVDEGDEVVVYYKYRFDESGKIRKLRFTSGDFPTYWKIVGDTLLADELEGQLVPAQLIYYKAKPQTGFTLSMSPEGDPTTLELTFDLFPDQIAGEDVMADIIEYRDDDLMTELE